MSERMIKSLGEITLYIAKGIPPKYVEEASDDTIFVLNQKCNRNFRISYENSRLHDNLAKKVPEVKMLKKARLQNETMITYPVDKSEQFKIARMLAALDDKILLNEEINKNLCEQ